MRTRSEGVEVPIIGSDSINWLDLSVSGDVPSVSTSTTAPPLSSGDYASSSAVRDPPYLHFFIWRIQKEKPRTLQVFRLSAAHKEKDKDKDINYGLRITFPDVLYPFAYVCSSSSNASYLLYALTVSGVAYLCQLKCDFSAYSSCSVFPVNDLSFVYLRNYYSDSGNNDDGNYITSIAATAGSIVIGRNDGYVAAFKLGSLHPTAHGFVHELRDDSGISRLWGFVSRGRTISVVQDLVIKELHGRKILFVLHSDGMIRIWDLSSYSRILSQALSSPNLEVSTPVRLWVGEVDNHSDNLLIAILYRCTMGITTETIYVHHFRCIFVEKFHLSVLPSVQDIPVEQSKCIDIKLTSDKMWILKDTGLVSHHIFSSTINLEEAHCYTLQEEFVAEQLFQSSAVSSDDLLCLTHSVFSSPKDQAVPFLSSLFLRRLLHPGVFNSTVLRSTFLDYNRHWADSEFQSLTIDGLKKEICLLVHREGSSETHSILSNWKSFYTRYFHHWCKYNSPCGLLVHISPDAIGLVRKDSTSLFRNYEELELLHDAICSFDDPIDVVEMGLDSSEDNSTREISWEVLRCVFSMNQQLGKSVSTVFESLVGTPIISYEEIVPLILKALEVGYGSSILSLHVADVGGDYAWEKKWEDHKSLRKFSVDMLLSLNALYKKAGSWNKILNVIENYLQYLVPHKIIQKTNVEMSSSINTSVLVQATSQIAKIMLESALDILLFVCYLRDLSGQISISHDDTSRIQLELVPMIQEIVLEWLIVLFLATTPCEPPAVEEFSYHFSALQIDSNGRKSWNEKLGKGYWTLAFLLLQTVPTSLKDHNQLQGLPSPQDVIGLAHEFTSWVIWGKTGEESTSLLKHCTELVVILLRNGQYNAVEHLITTMEAYLQREKTCASIQDAEIDWSILQHLLGCCFLAKARFGTHGMLKEKKICEAIRCFFRASSAEGACQALRGYYLDSGSEHIDNSRSSSVWKLHYYQWAMQTFEQYNISEGACQFALAALEQVDEALSETGYPNNDNVLNESATAIRGRIWANVFKFSLDLNHLYDAYCAILSNPDEESKYICLRRFVIVLYERGAMKILCDGQLPFIGLAEKVEQELAWKAERSDILAKPNLYKLLYAFEMHRQNWRKAASYMYQYSTRLRTELVLKDHPQMSLVLQERLNGISAAINALHLVHPAYAWIGPMLEESLLHNQYHPSKKAKMTAKEDHNHLESNHFQPQGDSSYIDVERLEKEFVLTSAELVLSQANVRWRNADKPSMPSELVALLVQSNFYDMAFTVVLKFWKDSELKRQLEMVFSAMSMKCCPNKLESAFTGNKIGTQNLLLTHSTEEMDSPGSPNFKAISEQSKGIADWEALELYLEKYRALHPSLPIVVAKTLLRTDPEIELPLWLIHMFKGGQRDKVWGMAGQESNPSSLLRLYVDYGRYAEATNLLLEYTESFASAKPRDLINRKKPFAVWFPYTTIQSLWCQLEEMNNVSRTADHSRKLKELLRGALIKHLQLLKVDSEDALASAAH